ncbi:MAG: sensor histidine kinase, partial [Clostridium perfringens]|nr:sensor histidine kinase [Clostridium perfringens]
DMIEDYILEYPDKNFEIIYSEDMSYNEFTNLLGSFTKNDIIICAYPYMFSGERRITYKDLMELISENVKDEVPFYGVLTYGIGSGVLGGKVVSHYTQGEEAGKIVNKILNGETSKDISIVSSDINEYVFDYNKLKSIGIKESSLPEGSIIINKPESFWVKYKRLILPVSLTILGLFAIIIAFIIYSVDQKKYEKEILKAKSIAETANKSKDHFISNISHELRTPVAVIVSANQLLKLKMEKYDFEEKQNLTEKLNIIDKNCYRLMRLVNNIIDIAKIDANFMKVNSKNLNAVELLEDLVMSVIPYAENKNVNIIFDTQEEEIIMALDKEKMERIVLNLLSNAIKFSKEGGTVFFNIYIEDNNLVFYVADNGIGIEKDDLEKIFEKFIQVDETMTRKNEGSGIGLSLVKSFVRLHNGKIYVESTPKEGSKFTVKLPITLINDHSDLKVVKNATEENNSKISTKMEFSDIYF